jgi:hypothetical protein
VPAVRCQSALHAPRPRIHAVLRGLNDTGLAVPELPESNGTTVHALTFEDLSLLRVPLIHTGIFLKVVASGKPSPLCFHRQSSMLTSHLIQPNTRLVLGQLSKLLSKVVVY